ncbi:hypothetical protein ACFXGR_44545 [Streptomyces mirabilis]|uniref:hypothetical protein n=1 Tax=Streptomyces mirabilis TaxID=68239 RepID=UPI00369476F7
MRNWEKALSVLEALREREGEAAHGWVLDSEFLLPQQQSVSALESPGLVELAGRQGRAELSAWESRPVRWAARLTPYGHDTLAYARDRPRSEPPPGEAGPGRRLVELIPSRWRRFACSSASPADSEFRRLTGWRSRSVRPRAITGSNGGGYI